MYRDSWQLMSNRLSDFNLIRILVREKHTKIFLLANCLLNFFFWFFYVIKSSLTFYSILLLDQLVFGYELLGFNSVSVGEFCWKTSSKLFHILYIPCCKLKIQNIANKCNHKITNINFYFSLFAGLPWTKLSRRIHI